MVTGRQSRDWTPHLPGPGREPVPLVVKSRETEGEQGEAPLPELGRTRQGAGLLSATSDLGAERIAGTRQLPSQAPSTTSKKTEWCVPGGGQRSEEHMAGLEDGAHQGATRDRMVREGPDERSQGGGHRGPAHPEPAELEGAAAAGASKPRTEGFLPPRGLAQAAGLGARGGEQRAVQKRGAAAQIRAARWSYFMRILRAMARSSSSRSCGRRGCEARWPAPRQARPHRSLPPLPGAHAPAGSSSPGPPSYPL